MPYSDLPPRAFWKLCRDSGDFRASEMWEPKFPIAPGDQIVTAGSCFAQNIARYLKRSDLSFLDAEPAPRGVPDAVARQFGYGLFSARYGNIYTARQLLQLIEDCTSLRLHPCAEWGADGVFYDGLRPSVEPHGLPSAEELRAHRLDHLRQVTRLITEMDVFIFTLGLTEAWTDAETGVVFPSVPGSVAGRFDPRKHRFVNMSFSDIAGDLRAALAILRDIRPGLRVILTVSPVPLTATATGEHVLAATVYSKSVLRAVAGEIAAGDPLVDYFPSYELVTGVPFAQDAFADNLRSVDDAAIDRVMQVFFGALGATLGDPQGPAQDADNPTDPICEEALLDAFLPE